MKHKIGIIGTGFVGTACEMGFSPLPGTQVLCYDKYKPSESLETVVNNSDILFVCLPTPMHDDGACNTQIVQEGVKSIFDIATKPKAIVVKSTVPPGTTESLQTLAYALGKAHHQLFFNPEFLTEAHFIHDFLSQKSVMIGRCKNDKNDKLFGKVRDLYADFSTRQGEDPHGTPAQIYEMDATTAEMVKYATNCFLATKLTFFNEIYQICDKINVDYKALTGMLALDGRIGSSHMQVPGPDGEFGFSKSCFPKDINALIAFAREHDIDPLILESVWSKNILVRETHDWENLAQVNGEYKQAI